MTVEVEPFKLATAPDALPKNDRSVRAERLGFGRLQQDPEAIKTAEAFYPKMSDEVRGVWGDFLPTYYSEQDWSIYNFDTVPEDVLGEIETAKSLGVFDSMEIWTAEGRGALDPMVVGVVGSRGHEAEFFQIVRWGDALAPFEEVKRTVKRLRLRRRLLVLSVLTVFALLLGFFVAPMVKDTFFPSIGISKSCVTNNEKFYSGVGYSKKEAHRAAVDYCTY